MRVIRWLKRRKLNHAPYVGGFTGFLFLLLLGIATLPFIQYFGDYPRIEGTVVLAVITAVTAGTAIHELRRPDNSEYLTVRPDFGEVEDDEFPGYGVRNFGHGPALYFQLTATLAEGSNSSDVSPTYIDEEIILEIGPHDEPLHIPEYGMLELIPRKPTKGDNDISTKLSEKTLEEYEEPVVHLRYSFVSQAGHRTPAQLSTGRDDENVLDRWTELTTDRPRRLFVNELFDSYPAVSEQSELEEGEK